MENTRKVTTKETLGLWCQGCGFTTAVNVAIATEMLGNIADGTEFPMVEVYGQTAFGAICPKCHHVIMTPIDREILYAVKRLNDIGYDTYASCQGHLRYHITSEPDETGWVYRLEKGVEFPGIGFHTMDFDKNVRIIKAWRKLHGQTEWRNVMLTVRMESSDGPFELGYSDLIKYRDQVNAEEFASRMTDAYVDIVYEAKVPKNIRDYKEERSARTFRVFLERMYFELSDNQT